MSEPGKSRATLERVSTRPLVFLRLLPKWTLPLVVGALLVAGLAIPDWGGAAALVLLAAFLGWLAALSWPCLAVAGRLLRVAAVVAALALAVSRVVR